MINLCLIFFAVFLQACKFSLRQLGPLMGSESINNKFQRHLLEDANLIYGEFLNDLAKLMVKDLQCNTLWVYFLYTVLFH